MKGKVYLVGAGPGSPDLITVRGRGILQQAEVVIYDYLVDKRILEDARKDAELICCDKLGKSRYPDGFLRSQERINSLMVSKAKEGKKVVRLKNGDPGIFSRTSQELEPLVKERIEFEIVPGVTAASAASCLSGIPLTDRRCASSCVFVTGHEDPAKKESFLDWQTLNHSGTLVLYMAVENLSKIAKELIAAGKSLDSPVVIIQDVSLLTQKILTGTLENIVEKAKKEGIKPPAIIIIGEVVRLEKDFNWLKKTRRILFTGISAQRFFEQGTIFHLPLIKIERLKDYRQFDRLIRECYSYDWIVFSSRYGVQHFFERFHKMGYDSRRLKDVKIAAIGASTSSRLLDFGVLADLTPQEESSAGLINAFKKIDIKGKKLFMPRSDLSDKGLTSALRAQGARVISCVAYRNVMPDNLPDLNLRLFDEVMFTSPSTVRNFRKRYGPLPKKVKASFIGEVTRNEARRCHLLN